MKSFNDFNDAIRKNINKRIICKSSKNLQKQKLNKINKNGQNNSIQNKIRNFSILDNLLKFKHRTKEHENQINKNSIGFGFKRNLSNAIIKKKEAFRSLNSKICLPIYINDRILMNDYSHKNQLEFKKYLETQ